MSATYNSSGAPGEVVLPQVSDGLFSREHVAFNTVCEGVTRSNGLAVVSAIASGAHAIEIISSGHINRISHIVNVIGEGRLAYIASMKPKLGMVYVEVKLSENVSKRNLVQFSSEYLFVSIVNIQVMLPIL
jgi:hypothetical protein